jgi:hypothetical protein
VNPSEQFTVDVFINEVPAGRDLGGFQYTMGFDSSRVRLVSQNHHELLASAPGSNVLDLSDPAPADTAPHILKFSPVFNSQSGDLMFNRRFDLNGDGKITISDVLWFVPSFGLVCS